MENGKEPFGHDHVALMALGFVRGNVSIDMPLLMGAFGWDLGFSQGGALGCIICAPFGTLGERSPPGLKPGVNVTGSRV